jgi:hypothetical protein
VNSLRAAHSEFRILVGAVNYYFLSYLVRICNKNAHPYIYIYIYINIFSRGADMSLARPSSRCIFFDGENISFVASLVIYIYIYIYIYI